ncbi:uncharacterized protein LOC131158358 isoform X2 [Malania oleifera]|uniref:uncharacterized protein LOC131158358 isoform X2 n=1 Tax=Malania oleifera TaxID=397392 RepID=UPI0025AE28A0|nr:uncharacterized protein LOC131158358 isoform X2 [Malania oleifera]XP_057969157.1 uncharacterized protein LOC131158358 isoform X2 [Malania oleifera]
MNTRLQSKKVYNGIVNGVRSNTWRRGRSNVASVQSDIPNAARGQKRVSKDERRATLESFVDRYRDTNGGKFPTVSYAQKQVGGSYYVIRKILQELEYKSKISPLEKSNEYFIGKSLSKENESLGEVEGISHSQMAADLEMQNDSETAAISYAKVGDANWDCLEGKTGSRTSTWTHETLPKKVLNLSTAVKVEAKDISHPHIEKSEEVAKEEAASEDLLNLDCTKRKGNKYQVSPESDKFARETSGKQTEDEEFARRPTLWGNLKSIADGIISLWRKR